jgi:hypothetical protein
LTAEGLAAGRPVRILFCCQSPGPEANMQTPEDRVSEAVRKQVFLALVEAQDGGMAVAQSREAVAATFGLTPADVRRIEREGTEASWPPLD